MLAGVLSTFVTSCDAEKRSGTGITYTHDQVSSVPWSIHIVKMDRSRRDLELHTTHARNRIFGLSSIVDQVQLVPPEAGQPIAAINGDFYINDARSPYLGDPRGLQIMEGELVSAASDQASFWIDAAGKPQATNVISKLAVLWQDKSGPLETAIGLNEERAPDGAVLFTPRFGNTTGTRGGRELILERSGNGSWLPLQAATNCAARVREIRQIGNTALSDDTMVLSLSPGLMESSPGWLQVQTGAVLRISTATVPGLEGVKAAISGGYVLVRDGKKVTLQVPDSRDYKYRSVGERHPRSAIGSNRDSYFFVEVDGRQPGLSIGMSLSELADYMVKLGCDLALSLDGGASSTLWLNGKVMNSPCNGLRPVANGLVLVRKVTETKR